jgi:pyridoxamine 5'-phosphate oxidase
MCDPTPNVPARTLRRDYSRGELLEGQALPDPIEQFRAWFDFATEAQLPEPNAMTLATATPEGMPSARVVLMKGFDARGFTFYTNYESRKGRELEANPRASLCFFWQAHERQVRIEGRVERVSRDESEAYFRSRPVSAQVGAWASNQSSALSGREALERRDAEFSARFAGGLVPLPEFWGGYRVVPTAVEFWQGRASRLHDRLLYTRAGDRWEISRLSP